VFCHFFQTLNRSLALVLGDFNVDWLSNTVSRNKLIHWCADNNFEQLIKSPTRKGTNSLGQPTQSCLDLCFVRHVNKRILTSTFDLPFSDHNGISITIGRNNIKPQISTIKKWKFTPDLVALARDNPPQADDSISDVNILASVLSSWLSNINTLAQSTKRIRSPPSSNPWYSSELSTLRAHYTSLPHRAQRNRYRNEYVSKVRSAKRAYIRNLSAKNENRAE